jgi:hypothetical protein
MVCCVCGGGGGLNCCKLMLARLNCARHTGRLCNICAIVYKGVTLSDAHQQLLVVSLLATMKLACCSCCCQFLSLHGDFKLVDALQLIEHAAVPPAPPPPPRTCTAA